MQDVLEGLRKKEVDRNSKRFHESDRAQVDLFSKALMKKVVSLLVMNLKEASLEEEDLHTAKAVTRAFAQNGNQDVNEILERLDHELSH